MLEKRVRYTWFKIENLHQNHPRKITFLNGKRNVILTFLQIQRMVISGGNFKPDTLKPKEVVSLLLDDEEIEAKCEYLYLIFIRALIDLLAIFLQFNLLHRYNMFTIMGKMNSQGYYKTSNSIILLNESLNANKEYYTAFLLAEARFQLYSCAGTQAGTQ